MSLKSFPLYLANLRPWLTFLAVVWLLGLVGWSWFIKSFLILVALLFLAPVLAFLGFRWWLSQNLVQDSCPVCQLEFTGLNNTQMQCPNCGEQLMVSHHHFNRLTPPGTIDVQAVEVSAKSFEDA